MNIRWTVGTVGPHDGLYFVGAFCCVAVRAYVRTCVHAPLVFSLDLTTCARCLLRVVHYEYVNISLVFWEIPCHFRSSQASLRCASLRFSNFFSLTHVSSLPL